MATSPISLGPISEPSSPTILIWFKNGVGNPAVLGRSYKSIPLALVACALVSVRP